VDWLRVLATLIVFAYHCARPFDTMEPWHIKNRQLTDVLSVPMVLGSQFMMPLFFILSGISTYYALGSRPASAFLRRRVVRLVVPLVTVGWFLLCPPQVYIEAVTAQGYHAPPFQGTFWQFLPHYFEGHYGRGGYFALTGMHLWYLLWLMGFSLLALPIFLYLRSGSGKRLVTALADVLERPGAIFLLALPLLLPELLLAPGSFFLSWREGGWALGTHLVMFVIGFLLVSDGRLRPSLQRQRWVALGLAVITLFPLTNWAPQMGDLPFGSLQHAVQWGLRTINGWLWLAAILGFGSLHLNFAHATLAYAGQAVLPFYILHQTVIVMLGYAIRDWPLGLLPKYLLLLGSAFAICISLYEFVIRRSNRLRFLFGMGQALAVSQLQGEVGEDGS
jgi:peptidoglycan/LPS O-acetylase OafA/YrhL